MIGLPMSVPTLAEWEALSISDLETIFNDCAISNYTASSDSDKKDALSAVSDQFVTLYGSSQPGSFETFHGEFAVINSPLSDEQKDYLWQWAEQLIQEYNDLYTAILQGKTVGDKFAAGDLPANAADYQQKFAALLAGGTRHYSMVDDAGTVKLKYDNGVYPPPPADAVIIAPVLFGMNDVLGFASQDGNTTTACGNDYAPE